MASAVAHASRGAASKPTLTVNTSWLARQDSQPFDYCQFPLAVVGNEARVTEMLVAGVRFALLGPQLVAAVAHCVQSPPPLSAPITAEQYFRLLKKSHVLDQLLAVSAHLESQQRHLLELEADRAKSDSVHEFVFRELETYKRKFVEAQAFLLEVVEAMTALAVREHELQRGTGTRDARETAQRTKEEAVMRDLEAAMAGEVHAERSVESHALRVVGLQRVEQLSSVCEAYEEQLKKSEAELSRAMHSAYKDECLAKLQQHEAKQRRHEDELHALQTRIDGLTRQTAELHGVIDDQRDEIAQLTLANEAFHGRLASQTTAIEQFGAELKAELRRRYGVVPSVVDARWLAFFPACAAPQ